MDRQDGIVAKSSQIIVVFLVVVMALALSSCKNQTPNEGDANGAVKHHSSPPSTDQSTGVGNSPSTSPSVQSRLGALNLIISPGDRASLRTTFLSNLHISHPSAVKGPLAGTVYYARYRGTDWAIATFSMPGTGTTDMPERFSRPVGSGQWTDLGDTGGPLSEYGVPCPVLLVWGFVKSC
jgi:hypothetical protein